MRGPSSPGEALKSPSHPPWPAASPTHAHRRDGGSVGAGIGPIRLCQPRLGRGRPLEPAHVVRLAHADALLRHFGDVTSPSSSSRGCSTSSPLGCSWSMKKQPSRGAQARAATRSAAGRRPAAAAPRAARMTHGNTRRHEECEPWTGWGGGGARRLRHSSAMVATSKCAASSSAGRAVTARLGAWLSSPGADQRKVAPTAARRRRPIALRVAPPPSEHCLHRSSDVLRPGIRASWAGGDLRADRQAASGEYHCCRRGVIGTGLDLVEDGAQPQRFEEGVCAAAGWQSSSATRRAPAAATPPRARVGLGVGSDGDSAGGAAPGGAAPAQAGRGPSGRGRRHAAAFGRRTVERREVEGHRGSGCGTCSGGASVLEAPVTAPFIWKSGAVPSPRRKRSWGS